MEQNSSLRPPSDLQQALDFPKEERGLCWSLEGRSSASPVDSEYEGDDRDQDHLRADVESLAGSSRSTSSDDLTANFLRLFGSDDDI
ncbi:hypothetical protein EPUL_003607 [Erysiphe pulchra]|uniref:Uncharacterized protein n=1 Tax=Erysiphe pulchra TaxID=225359 RepID=A0A2S4PYB3_9PEZI|nr:hypothetical protein EPUL_003607 [Erysiphe pulchra]